MSFRRDGFELHPVRLRSTTDQEGSEWLVAACLGRQVRPFRSRVGRVVPGTARVACDSLRTTLFGETCGVTAQYSPHPA
ncbi:hypothetical protein ElyMa_004206600 [Elysia marginata]|uniref:Uncharacterized protein n=1 Tax=Elysia marginata TaxID=1093978 RepID=A0AAV4GNB4_9GAST|nr:hypothetical protein ElyMa_004206600 [Elysia marginata]